MNRLATISRDHFALTDAEAQSILRSALLLAKNPRRDNIEWLNLIEAVDTADGNDRLAEPIAEWREYHGLVENEYTGKWERREGDCDLVADEMREARSSYGMGGKAFAA